jgi:DNA-binding transcriptional LysR family regulator
MSYQIELRHYRYFKAVAEELNFRKAASKLFISQPGLTRQIKQLEEALGAQLFDRDKRNVQLTTAGIYLLKEVEEITNKQKTILSNISLIAKGEMGEINIGFLGSAIHSILPEFLLALNTRFPKIHTSLEEMNNAEQIEKILNGKIDLGFVRMDKVPSGIHVFPVHEDSFTLVLPQNHEIDMENFTTMKVLEREPFILFSSDYSPQYFDKITSICEDEGFSPMVSHKSVHAFTIFKLVEQGLGIAIVPTSLKAGYDLNIKFIELKNIAQRTILSAIWPKENTKPFMPKIIDLITQT